VSAANDETHLTSSFCSLPESGRGDCYVRAGRSSADSPAIADPCRTSRDTDTDADATRNALADTDNDSPRNAHA
jgi:hypothetical protein